MRPTILVDLLGYTGSRGGTETYVRELVPRLADEMPEASFVAVTGRAGFERVVDFFPGQVRTVKWVGSDRATWAAGEVIAVSAAARRARADLIWSPANFGPITRGRVPRVVTIHDVIYHQVRGSGPARVLRAATATLMERTAKTARTVVTVSHAAADSIAAHMAVAKDRIVVVHNGSAVAADSPDPWTTLAALGIAPGRAILLSTGNRMPHKNFRGLLEAVRSMPSGARPLTVLPGGGPADSLAAVVDELDLARDVVLPGWVTSAQLSALYQVASVYACPSLTEGFGLPVVDAMNHGCLVVANDVPVLREVGGEHVLYADATDASAFARAISAALSLDPERAAALRREGREWASRFTWGASAAGTAAALRAALRTGSDDA